MITILAILVILAAATVVTVRSGIPATFTWVMLPTLLLVYNITPVEIYRLPNITSVTAVGYGTLLGLLLKGGEPLNLRLHIVDVMVLTLSGVAVVAAMMAEYLYTGVSTGAYRLFEWIIPYFMGRITFQHEEYRLKAAKVLVALALFLSVVALWEMRIRPLAFMRDVLQPLGLTRLNYGMVLGRFGLFRAQTSFSHPIDLGNGAAILGCMIILLATTARQRLTTPWVLAGVTAAGIMCLSSLSYTSFVAAGAIMVLFVIIRISRWSALLLIPISAAVIGFYVGYTLHLVEKPLEMPDEVAMAGFQGSGYIRHLIVHNTWEYVTTAGVFGYGRTVTAEDMGLLSIDNAYVLFIIRHGWLYTSLFIALLVVVCITGGKALIRLVDGPTRTPLAAGVAGIVGTMLGMYTVFFGFVYAQLFVILMGLTVSLMQRAIARTRHGPAGGTQAAFPHPQPPPGARMLR